MLIKFNTFQNIQLTVATKNKIKYLYIVVPVRISVIFGTEN